MKQKKIYSLIGLTCIVLLLSLNIILAQMPEDSTYGKEGAKWIAGTFSDFFSESGWTGGNMSANIAKIFFFVMIALVIYLVIGSIFPHQQIIMMILSALISFLATAYITPDEVYSLLISYTALGLTITTLIPLLILFGLTYKAVTATEGQVQLIMVQWFAWILFAAYSFYRFIYDFFWGKEGSTFMNFMLLGTAIVAAVMAVFDKPIRKILARRFIEAETVAAEQMLDEVWDVRRAERNAARRATGAGG